LLNCTRAKAGVPVGEPQSLRPSVKFCCARDNESRVLEE
jgi:hypothetical protein